MNVTNNEFLSVLFGVDVPWVHVTDFAYDPGNIPKDQVLISWKGDYYSRYHMRPNTNQYFTISNFYCDNEGQARRRKALYRHTPVIVLDDVKEKLSMDEVSKLPPPAWVLETSAGSEQWGYILTEPCTDRGRVENLLDGLVANGLAPDGKDPGMKGVTRYVRLPEGSNTKASKMVDGQPFKCRMLLWEPFNRVTLEQLAAPFAVDLDAVRRESRLDGAAAVSDHPLINIPEIIHIKEVRSDGRFDITCPWVEDHTNNDDSGSAVFTNSDGSIGFKCHHGSCQHRSGYDLLRFIDGRSAGFSATLKNWQIMRDFDTITLEVTEPTPSFMEPVATPVSFMDPAPATQTTAPIEPTPDAIKMLCDELRKQHPTSAEARTLAAKILKHTDDLPKLDQQHWHTEVRDLMTWTKGELKDILKDLRTEWYGERVSAAEFYDSVVFVKELNQFYDFNSRIFFSTDAFQNSNSHEDAEAKKIALQDGRVRKVDRLDYAPKQPRIFVENNTTLANTWSDVSQSAGIPGDHSRWYDHFDALGWGENRSHIEQWMAYTLRHPEIKINHMLLLGSGEGCGKDFLLYPLIKAMGDNHEVISGEELLEGFNDYILSTKYLHINETELGDRKEAMAVSNKLKPLAAAPPETLSVNQKSIKRIKIRNIINATMTTNSAMPLRLNGPSRRFYAVWSDLNPRGPDDNMRPEWLEYWNDRWDWMKGEGVFAGQVPGWQYVVNYLINHVDISKFNPAAPPPMTDFLRDIKESSESPMQQTLRLFMEKQHGAFRCDVVSSYDMSETLRAGIMAPADMLTDPKHFTPRRVGMMMREQGITQVRTAYERLWVIRNHDKYVHMTPTELYDESMRQMKKARGEVVMTVVK